MIDPLLDLIRAQPGMIGRLLSRHHDDGTGRCAGCVTHGRPRPRHPCTLRAHAEEAARAEAPRRP